jgi:hypothetical protein
VTTFTIRGGRNGSQVHVTWTDGTLSGDPPTVDLVEVEAELARMNPRDRQSWSHVVDPDGELPPDPLGDPTATWRLIRSVIDNVQTGSGDLPAEAAAEIANRPSRRA